MQNITITFNFKTLKNGKIEHIFEPNIRKLTPNSKLKIMKQQKKLNELYLIYNIKVNEQVISNENITIHFLI